MILLTIATLIVIALAVIAFLPKIPQRVLILSTCVCLLVLLNFLNEIQAAKEPGIVIADLPNDQLKSQIRILTPEPRQEHKEGIIEQLWGELIEDEKKYASLLYNSWEER